MKSMSMCCSLTSSVPRNIEYTKAGCDEPLNAATTEDQLSLLRLVLALLSIRPVLIRLRYTLLGQLESVNRSMPATLATQYPESLGEFSFDDIDDEELYRTWR